MEEKGAQAVGITAAWRPSEGFDSAAPQADRLPCRNEVKGPKLRMWPGWKSLCLMALPDIKSKNIMLRA